MYKYIYIYIGYQFIPCDLTKRWRLFRMFKLPSSPLKSFKFLLPGTYWALPTSGMLLHQEQLQGLCPASCRGTLIWAHRGSYEVLMAADWRPISQASSQQGPIQRTRHWPALKAWLLKMIQLQNATACPCGVSMTLDQWTTGPLDPPWPSPI